MTYDPSAAFIATNGSKNNSAVYRPNVIGDIYPAAGQQTINPYFNPATVLVPMDVTQPYGNAGRNIGRSNAHSISIPASTSNSGSTKAEVSNSARKFSTH